MSVACPRLHAMQKFREFTIALAASVVVAVVTLFTVDLSKLQAAGVFVGALVMCFVAPPVWRWARRRLAAFKAKVLAEVTGAAVAAVRAELTAQPTAPQPTTTLVIPDSSFDMPSLGKMLIEGRILQARLAESDSSQLLPSGLGPEIACWEAKAINVLADRPHHLADFKSASSLYFYEWTRSDLYNRMAHQIAVIETAIRHPNDVREDF